MSVNPYYQIGRLKKLVERQSQFSYKSNFVLTSNVNLLSGFDSFCDTMRKAAESSPDGWFIRYHSYAYKPDEAVKIVPSVLAMFNTSRTLRRAKISGLRMCNLYYQGTSLYYMSDMVVSCRFDAVALCSTIADYCKLGKTIAVYLPLPRHQKRCKVNARDYADLMILRFWNKTNLARHSAFITMDEYMTPQPYIVLLFKSKSLALWPLLSYVMDALNEQISHLDIGRNGVLTIRRDFYPDKDAYMHYKPAELNFRYKHFSAFGTFYNNPDYPIY